LICFKKVKWKNFLSYGNYWTEVDLTQSPTTLISGQNGQGKCVRKLTEIDISIEDPAVKQKFEEFLKNRQNLP
jgi:hypothetical protein